MIFAYAGSPALMDLLARRSPRPLNRNGEAPSLAVVIAVHNGAGLLQEKLERTQALSYPKPFGMIVAPDTSTDGSDEIARSMAECSVRLVRSEPRQGKETAQAAGIARASPRDGADLSSRWIREPGT